MDKPNIGCIVLAAGSSSRMGQSKQLLPINGEPLLVKVINEILVSKVDKTIVVLGAKQQEHHDIIKHLPVYTTINQEWEKGMGSSIKTGLPELLSLEKTLDAVIITVCDQPYLTHQHIDKLIETYKRTPHKIIGSAYGNTIGVPALFDKDLFHKILLMRDDEGAKRLIYSEENKTTTIPFPKGNIDLDTPEDFKHFMEHLLI